MGFALVTHPKVMFYQVNMGFDSGPSSWAGSVSPVLCLPGSLGRWTTHHEVDTCHCNKYPGVYMVSRPWSWLGRFPAELAPGVCISSFIPFSLCLTDLPVTSASPQYPRSPGLSLSAQGSPLPLPPVQRAAYLCLCRYPPGLWQPPCTTVAEK